MARDLASDIARSLRLSANNSLQTPRRNLQQRPLLETRESIINLKSEEHP